MVITWGRLLWTTTSADFTSCSTTAFARRLLQVEHDAALVAVAGEVQRRHARIAVRAERAVAVAPGRLDLDDVRAHVRQHLAGPGAEDDARQFDYFDSLQWSRHSLNPSCYGSKTDNKLGCGLRAGKCNRLATLPCGLLTEVCRGAQMYTTLFWIQTLLHVLLFVWLVRIYRRTGLLTAAVLFIPQFGLIWDNGVVAAGGLIGIGETLKALSWPRFWIHWLFGTWLIIACGTVLRLAGVRWVQHRWGMALFCLLTVLLMIYDLPHFVRDQIYPVCEKGLIRYSTFVSADRLCFEGQALTPRSSPPIPSIITCFIVIGTGLALLIRRRFPWMMLGGLLMLLSASPPGMKYKLDNLGEVLIAGGVIWALAFLTRARPRGAMGKTQAAGGG